MKFKINRRKLRLEINYFALFLLGVVFTAGIFLLRSWQEQKKIKEQQDRESKIIAPYYDIKSFELPSGLKKSSMAQAHLKIPIIMYHYVEYVQDINDFIRKRLDISPAVFEKELEALKEARFETYFVRDIPDILRGKKYYARNHSIVLTFDDGYEDFYEVVFPLLKKYNVRGTVYVINDFVGRKGFLTREQIVEMSHSGLVEIGAHTMDHAYLKNMARQNAKLQIMESKKELEEWTGMKVDTFAYPYGAFGEESVELVKEASFSAAVSVVFGSFQSSDNLFYLYRIRPGMFTSSTIIKYLEDLKK